MLELIGKEKLKAAFGSTSLLPPPDADAWRQIQFLHLVENIEGLLLEE
jgi:hypothetical protein